MRRRELITLLGGAAVTWPFAARAAQDGRVRRVGILSSGPEDDQATRANRTALREELAKLGWIEDRNLRIDLRFTSIEAAAPLLGVQAIKTPVRDPLELVRAIDAFAAEPNGGVLVVPVLPEVSYKMLHLVAAQHRLPVIESDRSRVGDSGLMYAVDFPDIYRRAAAYVDRILRGTKVSELPAQAPTKFGLVINLKTANAIGLTVPPSLIARADELIE
jgi:hypothetical protein